MAVTQDMRETRDAVIVAMLRHAAFDGWSEAALRHAEQEVIARLPARDKHKSGAVLSAFVGRQNEAGDYVFDWLDHGMTTAAAGQRGFVRLSTREKITRLIDMRLAILTPYRDGVRAWMRYLAMPPRTPGALRRAAQVSDTIWRAAGDQSADANYYSKRMILTPILAAAAAYWLREPPPEKLSAFIHRAVSAGARPPPIPKFATIRSVMEAAFVRAGELKNTMSNTMQNNMSKTR